jgi:outer membrane protein assembly factor BamB
VDGLQGPIDARILPGGRVLIAEYQGQVVTERDLHGKILWEKRLTGNPTVCQRLPNGNTFIATYHQLLEVTRGGKEVYLHTPDPAKGNIYSAQKLPNGRILCISSLGWLLEIDSGTGKVYKALRATGSSPYSVEALSGGRFLIANYNQNKVLEVDAAGKTIWQFAVSGAYHATRLPNGNTLVSSHAGRKVLEINRDGKTIWELPTDGHVWRVHRR